jgi:uncharacterized membrane protein YidH (DUF202 family)
MTAAPVAVAAGEPAYVQAPDPTAGLFGGMVIGSSLLAMVLAAVAMAGMSGEVPEFVQTLRTNIMMLIVVGLVVIGVCAVVGFVVGRSVARQRAMRLMNV